MDLDYISTRRLSRFYDNLKNWLSLNYSTKVELAEATQDMRGATEQFAGAHGLVPTPAAVDRNKFLKGDATWAELPVATTTNAGLMSSTDKTKLDGITAPDTSDSLLLGQSDGSQTWTALAKDTFGSITDDDGDNIQDETGNAIVDDNSVELWSSFNGTGFGAERAVADADGNNIAETYAKKGEASSVTTSYDALTKTLTINI